MLALIIIAWILSGASGWYIVMKGSDADGFDFAALFCCFILGPLALIMCLIGKFGIWLFDRNIKIHIP